LWWLYEKGDPMSKPSKGTGPKATFKVASAATFVPGGVQLAPGAEFQRITLHAAKGYQPAVEPPDMAPLVAAAAGKPSQRSA